MPSPGADDLGGSMHVRPAVAADAEGIGAVHAAAWRAGFLHLFTPDLLARCAVRRQNMWPGVLAHPSMRETALLLAESATRPIGFIHFGPAGVWEPAAPTVSPATGEVYGFYVEPSFWGTGVSGDLMRCARNRLAQGGAGEIILWTLEGAGRARGFYEKYGYTDTGRRRQVDFGEGHELAEVQYAMPVTASSATAE